VTPKSLDAAGAGALNRMRKIRTFSLAGNFFGCLGGGGLGNFPLFRKAGKS
jgi:hypothetical protein